MAGTPTFAGLVNIANFEGIRFADQYPGATPTQQLDAAIADMGGTGCVVASPTMSAGAPTSLFGNAVLIDLRPSSGAFKLYSGGVVTPKLSITSAGVVSSAFVSASSSVATSGTVRLANGDSITMRNLANTGNHFVMSMTGDQINIGTAAETVFINGPLIIAGAFTGGTTASFAGQVTSTLATGTAPFSITSTTVVPNLNVATLNGVTVSGAPTTGQSLVATGATTAAWSGSAGVYKVESAQYTPSTVSNSAAATNMMTFTLPANELTLGQAIRLTATGTCANASGGALNFLLRFMLGATSLCATTGAGASIANGATNGSAGGMWSIEALLICTAVGSSGTLEAQWITGRIGAIGFTAVPFNANTATIAINTTTTNVLATNITMSGADPSTTCTQRQMLIERLG